MKAFMYTVCVLIITLYITDGFLQWTLTAGMEGFKASLVITKIVMGTSIAVQFTTFLLICQAFFKAQRIARRFSYPLNKRLIALQIIAYLLFMVSELMGDLNKYLELKNYLMQGVVADALYILTKIVAWITVVVLAIIFNQVINSFKLSSD